MSFPKITYGVVVLNGEPFTRYCLKALYPSAHEIIVVEGANHHSAFQASPDGHSTDGTLRTLHNFIASDDPEQKVRVVTAECEGYPDGFWPGEKDEQSRAYAKRATGDWLWQVDIDEFYHSDQILKVAGLLAADPSISAVTFPELSFWGSFEYVADGPHLRASYGKFHRLFQWHSGYRYLTHRPPTVLDHTGLDLRKKHWLDDRVMADHGVFLYHYSQIFHEQVARKMTYYSHRLAGESNPSIINAKEWYRRTYECFRDPFHIHSVNTHESWLQRFSGTHPAAIEELKAAIVRGDYNVRPREMSDAEETLASRRYRGRIVAKKLYYNLQYTVRALDRSSRDWIRRRLTTRDYLRELQRIVVGGRMPFSLGQILGGRPDVSTTQRSQPKNQKRRFSPTPGASAGIRGEFPPGQDEGKVPGDRIRKGI